MKRSKSDKEKAMLPSVKAATALSDASRSTKDQAHLAAHQRAAIQAAAMGTSVGRRSGDLGQQLIPARRIHHALERARGKNLLICIKGYPDPDNIAASLCLQWLARHHDIRTKILHFEEISHYENRALVKKLDIEIEQYDPSMDLAGWDYFAVNDSQNCDLPIKLQADCRLLVFVDHHKSLGTVAGEFVDIRENSGSTSAVYAEYLIDGPT